MVSSTGGDSGPAAPATDVEGARKRAALETYVRHEEVLKRTARRYSICADDAEDALQRGLEILLTKAPSADPRELIRWTQTVVKHEALAVRRERERILSGPAARAEPGREDWWALIPARGEDPAEQVERREAIARSREALQSLKPQELRALGLLAEGYSYAEIGEITGFSQTKINRSLAEGRERFRKLISRSEDGGRCEDLRPLLSAFCDGEAGEREQATVREHLRACGICRATVRAYRAAPGAAAALAPALPVSRTLFERAHEALAGVAARFGGAGDSTLSGVASSGGSRGAGMAALAKVLAVCTATAGGAAACVAGGVVPAPLPIEREQAKAPTLERRLDPALASAWSESGAEYEPEPQPCSGAGSRPSRGRPRAEERTGPGTGTGARTSGVQRRRGIHPGTGARTGAGRERRRLRRHHLRKRRRGVRAVTRLLRALLLALALLAVPAGPVAAAALQPVNLRVAAGSDWQAHNDFHLLWDRLAGDVPAHAAWLRVWDSGGNVVIPALGFPWDGQMEHVRAPDRGRYRAEVWLEDSGGNRGPAASVSIAFDDTRPGPVRSQGPAGWVAPEHASVSLEPPTFSPVSGIRGYAFSVDRGEGSNPCAGPVGCAPAEIAVGAGAGSF